MKIDIIDDWQESEFARKLGICWHKMHGIQFNWSADNDILNIAIPSDHVLTKTFKNIEHHYSFDEVIDPAHVHLRDEALQTALADTSSATPQYAITYPIIDSQTGEKHWLMESGILQKNTINDVLSCQGFMFLTKTPFALSSPQNQSPDYQSNEAEERIFEPLAFKQEVETFLEQLPFENHTACLVIASINDIKNINLYYGYAIADEILTQTTLRLASVTRSRDYFARLSGNKFGFLLRKCSSEDFKTAAERFIAEIGKDVFQTKAGPVAATLSVGGAILPEHARSYFDAMGAAEQAHFEAKSNLLGTHKLFTPSLSDQSKRHRNIELSQEIVNALHEDSFFLAAQPVFDAMSNEILFSEGLLRYYNHDGELISAGSFIQTAETLGLTRLIDIHVLKLALEALTEDETLTLSINLSQKSAYNEEIAKLIASTYAQSPHLMNRLIIEITESLAIENFEITRDFIKNLHYHGCRIAIDDFGAGFTSFRYLKELNIDIVKIDGSYIETMGQSIEDTVFVEALAKLCKDLNILTVAEWVQSETDARKLIDWGINAFQSEFYAKPEAISRKKDAAAAFAESA